MAQLVYLLSFDLKPLAATGTYHRVLSLGAGKTEDGAALGTFAVNVSFSVAEHIVAKLEKVTEFFIFGSALGNISRKHTGYKQIDENR